MEELSCNWSPKLIVELIKSIAWPLVVIIIGFNFRSRIFNMIGTFLSKNDVSEFSATTSGISAKFVAAKQQSSEVLESSPSSAVNLPKNTSVERIKQQQEQLKTEYSEEISKEAMNSLSSLDIDDKEKIDLLIHELSLYQSAVRYLDINKVLFRSQYDLFYTMYMNGGFIRKDEAIEKYERVREISKDALSSWDWIKYTAYPVSHGLITEDTDGYHLTLLGRSYVTFMSKKPQLVDELAKL
ncbi:TPA: hypothetical protein ACXE2E_002922 [Klebsiella variicola]